MVNNNKCFLILPKVCTITLNYVLFYYLIKNVLNPLILGKYISNIGNKINIQLSYLFNEGAFDYNKL